MYSKTTKSTRKAIAAGASVRFAIKRSPCPTISNTYKATQVKVTSININLTRLESHVTGTFECKECNKTFKSAAWLTKHSRIHTNQKPYVCPNCCRGFIQLSSLRYHLGTHGKYSCDSCKKRYKTEDDLKEHDCDSNSGESTKKIWTNSEAANENETGPVETIIIEGVEAVG